MKSWNEIGGIGQTLSARKQIIELFILAVILSFSINMLSSAIQKITVSGYDITILLSGLLIILVLCYPIANLVSGRKRSLTIDAVISINASNEAVKIPGYKFSIDHAEILKAGLLENEAWKNQWDTSPLFEHKEAIQNTNVVNLNNTVTYGTIVRSTTAPTVPYSKAASLVIEAAEFVLLDHLSDHLNSHFRDDNISENDQIVEFTSDSAPKFINSNRFIKLLCSPLEDRAIFQKISNFKIEEGEILSVIFGSDGSVYKRFDLVLPIESKIKRLERGHFTLENNRFLMEFEIQLSGYNAILPAGFVYSYLGVKRERDINTMKLRIKVKTKIKLRSFFSFKNWSHYVWIDTFIAHLYQQFHFESFLKEINWNVISTHLHTTHVLKKLNNERDLNKNG